MRRSDKEISAKDVQSILDTAEYGVLSSVDANGQPYGVPLNYVHKNNKIYFHSALSGHKIDNITHNEKVSFCVVGKTKILPDKFDTEYESVVAFGVASEVRGNEHINALQLLLEKYCPEYIIEGNRYIERESNATIVYKIEISNAKGKAQR